MLATSSSLSAEARTPLRRLLRVAVPVLVAHALALGLVPTLVRPPATPLRQASIVSAVLIAPPVPVAPPSTATATTAESPQKEPAPPPRPHRAVRKPVRIDPATPTPPTTTSTVAPAAPIPDAAADPQPESSESPPRVDPRIAEAPEPAPADALAATPSPSPPTPTGGTAGADGLAAALQDANRLTGPVPLRVPGSVQLAFSVSGQQGARPLQGVMGRLEWAQDGTAYEAKLSLSLLFKTLRSQHSAGVIGPTGIEPSRFADTRRSEVASHFVRERGQVVFSSNVPSVALQPGAQDRLSVVMQLGAMLAGDASRYPPGSVIAIQTVGPRDADAWRFTLDAEESLDVPAGSYRVRKLTRLPRRDYDDKIEIWLASERNYLPVRIRQTQQNGDFADMQLRDDLPAKSPS